MSTVTRDIYSNGIIGLEYKVIKYTDAYVSHRNNDACPKEGFTLINGIWPDNSPNPPANYVQLRMYGAEILLIDNGGFIVTGFVNEHYPHPLEGREGIFTLERWHINK